MTKVISMRYAPTAWQNNKEFVYIGRAGKGMTGMFGNPIIVGKKCMICGDVHMHGGGTLVCYREYMLTRMSHDTEFAEAIKGLKDKTLVCFCKPAPCHGDVIKAYLD